MNLLLPRDGSIVIIDDEYSDAKPLIDILSKNRYPSIYFNGTIEEMPSSSLDRVRVVFADIQLIPALNSDQYASMILERLEVIISDTNGPYVLIIWSRMNAVHSTTLEERINAEAFTKKPIAIIKLNKSDYFETSNVPGLDVEEITASLDTRFDPNDVSYIISTIQDNFPERTRKTLRNGALENISRKIKRTLVNYKAFELLIAWEAMIQHATTTFISDLSSIHDINQYWDFNFGNIVIRLAQAQVGEHLYSLQPEDFFKAFLKTLNSAFSDSIDRSQLIIDLKYLNAYKEAGYAVVVDGEEYKLKWKDYSIFQLYINNALVVEGNRGKNILALSRKVTVPAQRQIVERIAEAYSAFNPKLNTKINIDLSTKKPLQPGIVYERTVLREKKRSFLYTYFDKDFVEKKVGGVLALTDADIDLIKFVELEVSPNCDYAQNKWLKNRVISGIIFPAKYEDNVKKDESLYSVFPKIEVNGIIYKMVFSFKLLKSLDISKAKKRASNVLFRIKNEPMADIITRMTSHANRIGLIEFK